MSKHSSKHHHEGEGAKLVDTPKNLINLLITSTSEKNWTLNQLVNEGSKHKQVLTALLLNRLYKLLITVEKNSKTSFEMQNGYIITGENDNEEILFPVEIPLNLPEDTDKEKIIEAISCVSKYEALSYAMAIQVIDWVIKTTEKVDEPVFLSMVN